MGRSLEHNLPRPRDQSCSIHMKEEKEEGGEGELGGVIDSYTR